MAIVHATGLVSDAFCLFFNAKTREVKAMNGSGRSPKALSLALARSKGIKGSSIPLTDLNSVTVPGQCSSLPPNQTKTPFLRMCCRMG